MIKSELIEKLAAENTHLTHAEVERLVREGLTAGTVMPPAQSVAVMRTMDLVRSRIGLRYPGE